MQRTGKKEKVFVKPRKAVQKPVIVAGRILLSAALRHFSGRGGFQDRTECIKETTEQAEEKKVPKKEIHQRTITRRFGRFLNRVAFVRHG
jgi:hypothetical protein